MLRCRWRRWRRRRRWRLGTRHYLLETEVYRLARFQTRIKLSPFSVVEWDKLLVLTLNKDGMDTSGWRKWLAARVETSDYVIARFGGRGLYDAEILLCCALSAVAASMWPGEGVDGARFTQLLVTHSRADPAVTLISIPRLVGLREDAGDSAGVRAIRGAFYPENESRVLTWKDIDQTETAVAAAVPTLTLRDIRRVSYATIIYRDLRSALVHEYNLPAGMSDVPMSQLTDTPSYFNMLRMADPSAPTDRRLYLPYGYIKDVVVSAATSVFDFWDRASAWAQPPPPSWWIEG